MKQSVESIESGLWTSSTFQQSIVDIVRESVLLLGPDLTIDLANNAFLQMFHTTEEAAIGTQIYELGAGQWDNAELHWLLEETLPHHGIVSDFPITYTFEDGDERVLWLNGRYLPNRHILLAVVDVTKQQQRQAQLTQLQQLNSTLTHQVAQRTHKIRELASELLVTEQKVRQRIAQALHDDLQQLIYSMRMQLQMMNADLIAGRKTIPSSEIAQLDDLMYQAYVMSRDMVTELTPLSPVGKDFSESLLVLAAKMEALHGLKIDLRGNDTAALDNKVSLLLLHILQDLLFNWVKHGGINESSIEAVLQENTLRLRVSAKRGEADVSTRLTQAQEKRWRLHNTQEQLRLLDGWLEVDSEGDNEVNVALVIPLDEQRYGDGR